MIPSADRRGARTRGYRNPSSAGFLGEHNQQIARTQAASCEPQVAPIFLLAESPRSPANKGVTGSDVRRCQESVRRRRAHVAPLHSPAFRCNHGRPRPRRYLGEYRRLIQVTNRSVQQAIAESTTIRVPYVPRAMRICLRWNQRTRVPLCVSHHEIRRECERRSKEADKKYKPDRIPVRQFCKSARFSVAIRSTKKCVYRRIAYRHRDVDNPVCGVSTENRRGNPEYAERGERAVVSTPIQKSRSRTHRARSLFCHFRAR